MNADQSSHEPESPWRPLALGIAVVGGILATLLRVVPHPPNFSAVGALGIFGGARLRAWQAYLLPLGIMVLSDLSLWILTGFDHKYSLSHLSRVYVYAGFMVYVLIGRCLHRQNSLASVALAATLGGVQFFVLTNFCEWLFQPWQSYYADIPAAFRYSRDWDGLVTCFAYALPFYSGEVPYTAHPFMLFTDFRLSLVWTVLGDVLFTTIYMLVYARLARRVALVASLPAPAPNA